MSPRISIDAENQTITGYTSLRAAGASTVVTIFPQLLSAVSFERREELEVTGDEDTTTVTIEVPRPDGDIPDEKPLTKRGSLRRSGTSTVITIPAEIMQGLSLETGDEVEVEADWGADKIVIRPSTHHS